ncbi:MAG: hypothetical protein ABSB35_30445 [Bryobacteraceae bacterium]|jgi:hypothetical protein
MPRRRQPSWLNAVGLDGKVCPPGPIPTGVRPEEFTVFAGILPEGKYDLVKAFQKAGHLLACAVMEPMTLRRCARRRWE